MSCNEGSFKSLAITLRVVTLIRLINEGWHSVLLATYLLFSVTCVSRIKLKSHMCASLLQHGTFRSKCQGAGLTHCWPATAGKQGNYNLLPLWPNLGYCL